MKILRPKQADQQPRTTLHNGDRLKMGSKGPEHQGPSPDPDLIIMLCSLSALTSKTSTHSFTHVTFEQALSDSKAATLPRAESARETKGYHQCDRARLRGWSGMGSSRKDISAWRNSTAERI